MSYVVLARKYRPHSFEQMVGQEHVVQALTNALQQQRLHHAYLFTGTRGIGKTTVSRILAKSLNCTGLDGQGGITARPCGQCTACTEIDADRYIDYVELDAASNRGIDEIRDLLERAAYKPSIGRFKVFMIDEAHQLTKESFNALLKTLEEPPEYLKFVLATTDPDKMLPTVLSRCLQFNLRPMAPEVVLNHLREVLQAEGVAHDDGSLRLLSRAARGSMRDALSLTDQAIAFGGGQLAEAGVRAMLGTVDRGHAHALVQALADRDGRALLAAVDGLRQLGLSPAGTLEEMAQLLQQMAIEQAVPGALDAHEPEQAEARRLAALLAADETQLLYSIVLQGRGDLNLATDEYGALTMVLLRWLAFAVPAAPAAGAAQPRPPASALQVTREARTSSPPRTVPPPLAAAPAQQPQQAPIIPTDRSIRAPAPAPRTAPAYAAPSMPEPPAWLDEPPMDDGGAVATLERPAVQRVMPAPLALDVRESTPDEAVVDAEPQLAVDCTPLGDRWAALVASLTERGAVVAMVRELAMQAELVAVQDDGQGPTWQLRVARESLRNPSLRDKLQAAIAALETPAPRLDLQAGVPQDSPARREAVARERRQRMAEDIIHNDPLVQDLMAQFKTARLVPGSIKPL
jgi:DNA polymerase-3 subunit gamma/tau